MQRKIIFFFRQTATGNAEHFSPTLQRTEQRTSTDSAKSGVQLEVTEQSLLVVALVTVVAQRSP